MQREGNGKNNQTPPTLHGKMKLSPSQKAADKLAKWLGSWTAIFLFLFIILGWIFLNVYAFRSGWDPYPFILLNLVLSCLAALQAPIILMSQNRTAERDRLTAKYDYLIDRKSEREIREIKQDLEEIKKLLQNKK